MKAAVYWRTVRHLRLSQILTRLRYMTRRQLLRTFLRRRWAWRGPGLPPRRDDLPRVPRPPSSVWAVRPDPDRLADGFLHLLNESVEIGRGEPDWRLGARRQDRLWTVTLHYHEWIEALARTETAEAAALVRYYLSDWIRRCGLERPGAAALAWNAYAMATRLGCWIRTFSSQLVEPGSKLEGAFLRSLWEQAAYLHDHVELDLMGNHVMRDAVGLAWAGRFFSGPRPRVWLRRAAALTIEQIEEQILADGGHFERSPKYHVDVMEDLLALSFLLDDPEAEVKARRAWEEMARYLAWMRHPDGDLALFNDGSLVGTGAARELLALGERIGVEVDAAPRRGGRHFAATGMTVWHGTPWSLFFDAGPVGPDEQPGHAHADTLSIECSFKGRRLFVDPGTFSYDDDENRRYDRSTAAHNTVEVDGTDSSEMWRIFRVGRRARPLPAELEIVAGGMKATAAHDGYDHLPGGPRHHRDVEVRDGGRLVVVDRVLGSGAHRLRGGFLVEPSWHVEAAGGGFWMSAAGHRLHVALESEREPILSLESRPYHPRYGVEQPASRITWQWQGQLPFEIRTVVEAS